MNKESVKTIEKQVATAILQQPLGVVTLRGQEYPVNHPSPATLIMVSQLCAEMPSIDRNGNILTEVLLTAKDCEVIGKVIATLILGAKRIREHHIMEITRTRSYGGVWRRFFHLHDKQTTVTEKVAEIDYFTEVILEDFSPSSLKALAERLFHYAEVADFFGLSTSLSVANLLKRTKEVETVSGE